MSTVRDYYEKLKFGKPGERFKKFHKFRNEHREGSPLHSRPLTICLGVVLVIGGIAIGWLPGPGGVIGLFGLAILGAELKPLATLLDVIEAGLRKLWDNFKERLENGGIVFRGITIIMALAFLTAGVWLAMRILEEYAK